MHHPLQIGQKSPLLSLSDWVQGKPTNIDALTGKIVLVEVFQVNCPGCFLSALPRAVRLHEQYSAQGLCVLGVATAFEDFDKNNLENLLHLVNKNEVIGETLRVLGQKGKLSNGKLTYRIPFPLAMDRLKNGSKKASQDQVTNFIKKRIPNFHQYPLNHQEYIRQQTRSYLQTRLYTAETFDRFNLQGTPSHIVVDKKGKLSACELGAFPELEAFLVKLLRE